MVTQIQLGNFFSANGRTVLGGAGGSGLDTRGIIEALVAAKRSPAIKYESIIKQNAQKIGAISEFNALLIAFRDAANFLRNPPGVNNADQNAFRYTTTSITSNTSVSGSSYISVSASPGSAVQGYTIDNIESLAQATKQKTEIISVTDANTSVVSDTPTGDEFKAGTFTLNGEIITFNVGDSLNTVVAKFNAVADETGIRAALVKIADGQYQISFTGTQTGTANDFDFNNLDPAGTLVDGDNVFDEITVNEVQDATDAIFTLNDEEITRSSNTISDVIDGLTFTLLQTTPVDTEITIEVETDEQVVKSSIINFLNAYNDLKIFAAKQQQTNDDGTYAPTAILANNSALRSTMSGIGAFVSIITSRLQNGDPPAPAITFVDIPASGDSPLVRNALNLNEAALDALIESDLEEVRTTFEFDFVTDNPNIRVFSRTNDLGISAMTLAINPFATQTTDPINVADTNTTPIVFDAPAAGQLKSGVITIRGETITLEDGDTLDDIVSKFAAVSGDTGVTAAITGSAGAYELVFTSTLGSGSANFDLTSEDVNPDDIFNDIGITATGTFKASYTLGGDPFTIDLTATATASGYTLEGVEGTVLEGLVLIYGGSLASTSAITMEQGIADKIYNLGDEVLDETSGAIAIEVAALQANDSKLKIDIAKIDEQVIKFRDQMLLKFSALEQALSRINTLLQALDAQYQARRNASS